MKEHHANIERNHQRQRLKIIVKKAAKA